MYLDNAIASIGKDGVLFLETNSMYHADYGVEPWSRGLCAYTNKNGFWQKCNVDTELILVSFRYMADVDLAMHQFISDVPVEVCKAVRDIRYLQLPMLQAAANSRYFRDLLVSTPFLAWMLMDHAINHNWPDSKIDKVSQRKQTMILNEISGVSEKSYIRLLRAIQIDEGSEEELGLILKSMRSDIKRSLHHQKKVPIIVLEILIEVDVFLDSSLICFFINHPFPICLDLLEDAQALAMLWRDTSKTGSELQIFDAEKRLRACRGPKELFNLHDRWVARYNKNSLENFEHITFPEPPILETSTIIGIRNYADLLEEGRTMEHCVGTMRDEIISGEAYIYQVLEPVRGTLKVTKCYSNINESALSRVEVRGKSEGEFHLVWEIEDFRLKKNRLPSEKLWDVVNDWINHFSTELRKVEDPSLYRKAKWGEN